MFYKFFSFTTIFTRTTSLKKKYDCAMIEADSKVSKTAFIQAIFACVLEIYDDNMNLTCYFNTSYKLKYKNKHK